MTAAAGQCPESSTFPKAISPFCIPCVLTSFANSFNNKSWPRDKKTAKIIKRTVIFHLALQIVKILSQNFINIYVLKK